jgi:hypothetical protein
MPHFRDHFVHELAAIPGDGFERCPQFVPAIGRDANCIPIQFRVPSAESASLAVQQRITHRQRLPLLGQEFVTLHPGEFLLCIQPRAALAPEVIEVCSVVPASGIALGDENRLPHPLTSRKRLIQMCQPFSHWRVWPPVTTDVDDACERCSMVAWLYRSRPRDFSCRVALFSGLTRHRCFQPEKSPLNEVEDDHAP